MNHLFYVNVVQLHAFLPPLHPALETGAEKICTAAADPFPRHSLRLVVVFILMATQMAFQLSKEMEVARRQVWAVWRLAHECPTQPFDLLVGDARRMRAGVVVVEFDVAGIQCYFFLSHCTLEFVHLLNALNPSFFPSDHPLSAASRVSQRSWAFPIWVCPVCPGFLF